jgi:uncharacterized protein
MRHSVRDKFVNDWALTGDLAKKVDHATGAALLNRSVRRGTEMTRAEIFIRIEDLKQQLVAKYAPDKIILFGSAAREDGEINDVDLFIIKDNVPHLGADRIRELYRLINTDLPVDYLVYRPEEVADRMSLADPFVTGVLMEGRLLYG